MISTLTIANLAGTDRRTYVLAPKGPTQIAGPSGSGKSTLVHALLCLLAGDAPNRKNGTAETLIECVTGAGTQLGVRATKSGTDYSRNGEPLTRAAYLAALGKWGGETVRLIVAPMAWRDLATGTAQPLRDALAKILPAGDVPGRVREIMGADYNVNDPADPKGAAELQTISNAARERAEGREQEARGALARANNAPTAGPSPDDVASAAAVLESARVWSAYDARAGAWTEHDRRLAAWSATVLPVDPAYDAQEHSAARVLVARLEGEEKAAREAAMTAAAVVAERERAARESAEKLRAENARRDSEREAASAKSIAAKKCKACGQSIPNSQQESV